MKVALSTPGKFHTFDLARELYARDALAAVFTGYPHFKLKNSGIPRALTHSFPWVQGAYMAFPYKHYLSDAVVKNWEHLAAITFGQYVKHKLPACDLYVGLSGSSLPAGKKAHLQGARYVCDRGSSHIRYQDAILRAEYALWGLPFTGVDARVIAREEEEYQEADCITVPSTFVLNSFIEQGIAPEKMRLLPYGVNLSLFQPVASPAANRFDILFVGGMSLRKGVQYLVEAYQKIHHPAKSLTFVGAPSFELIDMLKKRQLWPADAKVLGHMPQTELKRIMSTSHVMVLPSIEEGLAMVQAQAMACACPVIGSKNSGAENLFTDGQEGYIVPIRSVDAIAEKLQYLADNPDQQKLMSAKALAKVQHIGGWSTYGDLAFSTYQQLLK